MDNTTKSKLLFIVCILVRVLIVYVAKNYKEYSFIMSLFALAIATGFLSIYLFGLRKTGGETFGELIWWNDLRPIHSAFYYLFAITSLLGLNYSWMFLAGDVSMGTLAFINHRLL